jgi:uncharacterized membrane protein
MPLVTPSNRLEAFSDGVIAVIITIMVLELKVPHQPGLAGFLTVLPTLGVYALSFTFVGVYWINHHHLCHRTDETDQAILYANLFFLFNLSLLPFFTSYLLEKQLDFFSVILYIISMIVTGFAFLLLRLSIGWRLRHSGRLLPEDRAAELKHWTSLAIYLLDIPLAYYHPRLALGVIVLVMVVWIYPTAHLHNTTHHPSGQSFN